MAAFTTVIARNGFEDEIKKDVAVNCRKNIVTANSQNEAVNVATGKFTQDALDADWVFYTDTVEPYEMLNDEGVLMGWEIDAYGHPNY